MNISQIIEKAAFTEYDLDTGTAGLCGMFALALFHTVIERHPTLILIGGSKDGQPVKSRSGGYYWSHAAVKVDGLYYDIEGEQQVSWMFSNYASVVPLGIKPTTIKLDLRDFLSEMHSTKNAWDESYYLKWKQMLAG